MSDIIEYKSVRLPNQLDPLQVPTGLKDLNGDGSLYTPIVSLPTSVPVALNSPPSALVASTDTVFTFVSPVKHLLIQNNSATAVGLEFDAVATPGSYRIAAGAEKTLDVPVTALHLYSTAATPVNGAAGSNIVLKGWS